MNATDENAGRADTAQQAPLSFGELLGSALARALGRPGTVFCALVLPPLYAVVIGVMFGTDLVMPVGGFGFPDPSLVSFGAVVIVAYGLLLTPVDLTSSRANGELRRFVDRPLAFLAADLVARVLLVLAGIVAMFAIGMLVFGLRPGGGPLTAPISVLATALATVLGAAAFLTVGQLLAVVLPSRRCARVFGHVLLYPLVLVSGAVIPLSMLPDMVRLAGVAPPTRLVELLRTTWLAPAPAETWQSVGSLLVLLGVAATLMVRRARVHARIVGP